MPFGAECQNESTVRFRLWAPKAEQTAVLLPETAVLLPMNQQEDGWFELVTDIAGPGILYQFEIDGQIKVPDPASRFQPQDVHGPSQIIAPQEFEWDDASWVGRPWDEAVIYELHIGTFSPEGTFEGLEKRLDHLCALGVTAVELMPLSDFPGGRNWGYDGVLPFAPDNSYGTTEDLKRFIQSAHGKGLMVFLDVVYNHFGPEGNYLREYAPQFFTDRHKTPWGDAINFDGPGSPTVRSFFIHNALYWLTEYYFDGLRLDAVHSIFDDSRPPFLEQLAETVRRAIPQRHVHLILENDANEAHFLTRDEKLRPVFYDAQWNDDIHHAFHVVLTGETDGYYTDYADRPQERIGRCLAEGFDYQGQPSRFRGNRHRGEPSRDLPPASFVSFLQNHDQIGNRAFGDRISRLADPCALKATTAILLLAPSPPLLFMGEEFGAETPFLFFCDFGPELAKAVSEGRRDEFARFERFRDPVSRAQIPDPNLESTFLASKLDWDFRQGDRHQGWLTFTRRMLEIRRREIVPLIASIKTGCAIYSLFGRTGLAVRWPLHGGGELLLVANLGPTSVSAPLYRAGQLLLATPSPSSDLELGPWAVRWVLQA